MARTLRHVRRLRSLSETECYIRFYGGWDPTVTLVKVEPRRPRYELRCPARICAASSKRASRPGRGVVAELDAAEAAAEAA